jgi:hypothetical protein
MLFLDGVYIERCHGLSRFRSVKAPTSRELAQLAHTIAQRVGRFLERQGLLEGDAENSYLAWDAVDEDPIAQLLGHSITYRIAVGPQAGRRVFTLQRLPATPGRGGARLTDGFEGGTGLESDRFSQIRHRIR